MSTSTAPAVIALKWWNERKENYPHHYVTKRHPGYHPEGINKAAKDHGVKNLGDYITAGLDDGNRIWGFKTFEQVDHFKRLIGYIT
jgi:hypothetical protein